MPSREKLDLLMRCTDPEDEIRSYFRSDDRLLMMNGEWYFSTRDGEVGPFKNVHDATREIEQYVKEREDLQQFQASGFLSMDQLGRHEPSRVREQPDLRLDELFRRIRR